MSPLDIGKQRANIIGLDAALQSLDAVDGNHGDAVAIALEDGRVAPDIYLVEGEMGVRCEVFQVRPRFIAQVTTSFRVEQDCGIHVRFLRAA